jgi:hypothetical protein
MAIFDVMRCRRYTNAAPKVSEFSCDDALRARAFFALFRIVLGYGDAPSPNFPACCSLGANAAAKRVYSSANTIQTGALNRAQTRGN